MLQLLRQMTNQTTYQRTQTRPWPALSVSRAVSSNYNNLLYSTQRRGVKATTTTAITSPTPQTSSCRVGMQPCSHSAIHPVTQPFSWPTNRLLANNHFRELEGTAWQSKNTKANRTLKRKKNEMRNTTINIILITHNNISNIIGPPKMAVPQNEALQMPLTTYLAAVLRLPLLPGTYPSDLPCYSSRFIRCLQCWFEWH